MEIENRLQDVQIALGLTDASAEKPNNEIEYAWYVGATGTDDNGVYTDFSDTYIAEGRWENRYDNKYIEQVNSIKVGDRIVIKSSYTKKRGLPFDNHGKTIGVMGIKAIGTVTENCGDGKNLKVDWKKVEPTKEWYGDGVLRTTAHCVRAKDSYIKKALLMFTFYDMPQDYSLYEEDDSEEIVDTVTDSDGNDIAITNFELPKRKSRNSNSH